MANTVLRVGLPAALAGAVLGGGAWMLASQGGAEAAPRNAAARPAAATKYDRVTDSGNVFYKVPAGYVAVKQKGGVIMVRQADIANGELNGYLLLTDGLQLDAGMTAKMKAAGKTAAVSAIAAAVGNLADDPDAKLTAPQLANDPAADGYEGYVLVSQSQDKDAGKTRFTQYAVFLVGGRAEVAMRVAYGSRDKLDPLLAGMDALTYSMEFRNAGAPPPARLAAALPTDLAAITPKPKPAPAQSASAGGSQSKGGGRNCRVTQYRQQCSHVFQRTSNGFPIFNYNCHPVPYTPAGC